MFAEAVVTRATAYTGKCTDEGLRHELIIKCNMLWWCWVEARTMRCIRLASHLRVCVLQAPCPGGFCQGLDERGMHAAAPAYLFRFSWVRLYASLLGTVQLLRGQRRLSTVLDI